MVRGLSTPQEATERLQSKKELPIEFHFLFILQFGDSFSAHFPCPLAAYRANIVWLTCA